MVAGSSPELTRVVRNLLDSAAGLPETQQALASLIKTYVTGRGLKEAQVRRAIELSATKYCSASMMLERGGVEITHDYEIREAE
jgi:uncharacterized OsmC-like protein